MFVFVLLCVLMALLNAMPDLVINNCDAIKYEFQSKKHWSIEANAHCGEEVITYEVKSKIDSEALWQGIYEPYGIRGGVARYEYVLPNGVTFMLFRYEKQMEGSLVWVLAQHSKILFFTASNKDTPPTGNHSIWTSAESSTEPTQLIIKKHVHKHRKPIVHSLNAKNIQKKQKKELITDGIDKEEELLNKMLHPLVGNALGLELKEVYRTAQPVPAITLDKVFKNSLLLKALDFLHVPIEQSFNPFAGEKSSKDAGKVWVGPETFVHCCKDKYRLDFKHWRGTKYSRALQSIASNKRFISFLEGMTSIRGLIPMKIAKEEVIWAGSTVIGVKPGGYLLIHNDFNYMEGLHRRINVLLYLNEEWEDKWQGHLELWDRNNTRCIQRIPPIFNRMSIFTVTDDAFHGHPEPLQAPPGHVRYALQIVYYTRESPVTKLANNSGIHRNYHTFHGAVFQPMCSTHPDLRAFCEKHPEGSMEVNCQCNYRDS